MPHQFTDPSGNVTLVEILTAISIRPITVSVSIGAVFGGGSYLILSNDPNFFGFLEATVVGAATGFIAGSIGVYAAPALSAVGISGAAAPYVGSYTAGFFGTFYAAKRRGFSTKDASTLAVVGGAIALGGGALASDKVSQLFLISGVDDLAVSASGALVGSGSGAVFDTVRDVLRFLDQAADGEFERNVFGDGE